MGAKLIKFEVINFHQMRVIGKFITVPTDIGENDHIIEDLWKGMKDNGNLEFLFKLSGRTTIDKDYVGWMGDFNPGENKYTYLAGVLFDPKTTVPEGYEHRDIANCEMAVAWLEGTPDGEGDVHVNASEMLSKARDENGYEYDGSNGFFEMEYYSEKRFHIPEKQGKNVTLDFYSPSKKKV